MTIELYFSQHFGVSPKVLEDYGAFDISLASDLPLFIDPFLLFNSQKPKYRDLHEGMIRYLVFLRDRATPDLDPGLIKSWYMFQEVKQNWLGFTVLGNSGSGLGKDFARALHNSLGSILKGFGSESITKGAHLETAAVSAALAEKFLNVGGDTANDLGQLLEAYNDLTMATKYSATSEKLKKPGLAAEDKATLERERDAYLKYIQNDDVKEIVTAAESK